MLHDLWSASVVQSHNGSLHRHRFREHKSKRLLEARKRKDVTGRQQRRDIRALAKSNTVATLLPGCDFHLGLQRYAPARALIDAGAVVGLATDFNPGTSPTLSMAMVLSLACTQLRMTPAEAISAATINAAYSLGRHRRIGAIASGKQADLAVFEVADSREIPYYFGVNTCWLTMKRGEVVHMRE